MYEYSKAHAVRNNINIFPVFSHHWNITLLFIPTVEQLYYQIPAWENFGLGAPTMVLNDQGTK